MGVAVVFNEEEEGFEIRDESDEENEEAEEMEEAPPSHSKEMRNSLLGCQISDVYPDPVTATEEAAAILSILGCDAGEGAWLDSRELAGDRKAKARTDTMGMDENAKVEISKTATVLCALTGAGKPSKLLEHPERCDEAEDGLRIPIAVGVVQISTLATVYDTTDDTGQMHSVIFRQAIDATLPTSARSIVTLPTSIAPTLM
ncbi:hypothetical protein WOLCODRAFT_158859 [Wolfiporia cocos MD-104 SS10]|uniref:Uncharacterized protein n=1 Tax=Wolfiporia cocos (strain MD-104) TaxID=742152 RepID=A0A2H3JRK7_WOLCO|nr:hypothetical protein WOLCODRAFT_158859 [Wolfiporia cocos MD-104 SS10]